MNIVFNSIWLICILCMGLSHASDRPNIIFILADDLGYGDLSYSGGTVPTPYIDQLANEGMRFDDAHTTSSVCTPTRYSILTGRYNWRSPLKSVTFGLSDPIIPTSRKTIASHLKANGYRTGFVGKWHLGLGWHRLPNGEVRKPTNPEAYKPNKKNKNRSDGWDIDYSKKVEGGPNALGFDESFYISVSLDMYPYVYLKNDKPTDIPTMNKAFHRPGPSTKEFEAKYCLIDFARESRAFIKNNASPDKPFFSIPPLNKPSHSYCSLRKVAGQI